MTEREQETIGYTSKVHKSLVEEDRLLGVPYMTTLANAVLWVITFITFEFWIRLLIIGGCVHGLMAWISKSDIYRIPILGRYLMYRMFYGRRAGMGAELGAELPWGFMVDVGQGIMQTKKGGLLCTYEIEPHDLGSLSEVEQGTLMLHLNSLKRLKEGWALWAHAKHQPDTPPIPSESKNPAAAVLDREWYEHLTADPGLWATVSHLSFYHQPPSTSQSLLKRLFFQQAAQENTDDLVGRFIGDVSRMMGVLSPGLKSSRQLSSDELSTYLRRLLDPDAAPIKTPVPAVDLSYKLSDGINFWHGTRPLIGSLTSQRVIRVLTLSSDMPDELHTAMQRALHRAPIPFDLMVRWMPMARTKAQSFTSKKMVNWLSKEKGWIVTLHEQMSKLPTKATNIHTDKQAKDADEARDGMLSDEKSLGHIVMTLSVQSPPFDPQDAAATEAAYTEADRRIHLLQTIVEQQGLIYENEDLNATDAVLGMMPGELIKNVRRHMMNSLNYVHLVLTHLPWGGIRWNDHLNGPPLCYAITEGCMLYGLDAHVGDQADSMTIGSKGSGKSTENNFVDVLGFLKHSNETGEAQVEIYDVGGSCRCITMFLNGVYYDIGGDESYIQILFQVDKDSEVPWIHKWLVDRVAEKNVLITPEVDKIIAGSIRRLRENTAIPRNMRSLQSMLADHLRFTDMASNSKIDANGMSRRDQRADDLVKLISMVKGALSDWTQGGQYGHLVDATEDRLSWSQVSTFEIRKLLDLPGAYPGVLEVLRHRTNQRIDGRPTRKLYSEAHEYFSHPIHVATLKKDIPHWRRDNCSANFSTQAIEQLTKSDLKEFLLGSCHTRFFLPNASAMSKDVQHGYLGLELSSEEIFANIATAVRQSQVYVVRPDGRRLVTLRLPPMAQMVCGSNTKEAHRMMDEIVATYGVDEFPWRLLAHHGYTKEAEDVRTSLTNHHARPTRLPQLHAVAAAD